VKRQDAPDKRIAAGCLHSGDSLSTIARRQINILPGEFIASRDRVVVRTLLGSCIAACLWDDVNAVIGMNHFLLPDRHESLKRPFYETDAGRYGVNAMELLINAMLQMGAKRKNLRAKVFGGASMLASRSSSSNVSEMNCRFVREFLDTDGIPLIAADLGGDAGRIIYFLSHNFSVYVKTLRSPVQEAIAREETKYLYRFRKSQGKTPEPELWA
jgi:chemotaxis protein CheD